MLGSPGILTLLLPPAVLWQGKEPCQPRALPAPNSASLGFLTRHGGGGGRAPPQALGGRGGASTAGQTCLTKSALCKEGAPGGLPLAQTHGSPRPGLAWGHHRAPLLCPTAQPHAAVCPRSNRALRCGTCKPHQGRDAPRAGCLARLAPSPPLWKRRMLRRARNSGGMKSPPPSPACPAARVGQPARGQPLPGLAGWRQLGMN